MSDRKSLGESKTQHLEVKITIFLWTKALFQLAGDLGIWSHLDAERCC